MKKKRSSWIYIVLGIMLFSLMAASAIPLVGSVVAGKNFSNNSSGEVVVLSQQELTRLEAEATGYQKVLDREPENDTALTGLLKIRLQQKDILGAVSPLEKLAKLHLERTEYGVLLAQAKQQLEDYEGAASAYKQVLAKFPGDIYALGGITNLYLAQELPERAIALLKKTIKLATVENSSIDQDAVELLLGELYTRQERYGEAVSLYDELAQANQDDFRPVLAKALVLEKQGNLEDAKPILEKAYVAAPEQYKDQIGDEMEKLVTELRKIDKAKETAAPAAPAAKSETK